MKQTLILIFLLLLASCEAEIDHEKASKLLFGKTSPTEMSEGFAFLKNEYEEGSAYSAGKLGWAYQKGLSVETNILKAVELYDYAAKNGMTYWQYMLAHAYEMGYLGLEKNQAQRDYWLNYPNKVHVAAYECWVEYFYVNGYFPQNKELEREYASRCKNS